jgi:hypothetical protein
MIQPRPIGFAAKFVNQRKRRAGEIIGCPPPATDALRQTRLACTQLAFQTNHNAAAQQLTQSLADARSLSGTAADEFYYRGIQDRHKHTDRTLITSA